MLRRTRRIGIGLFTALAALTCKSRTASAPPLATPGLPVLVVGHMGAPYDACENTLKSFLAALAQGANALELDLALTRDAAVVVYHDWDPDRRVAIARQKGAAGRRCRPLAPPRGHPLRRPVHELTLAELRAHYGYADDDAEKRKVPIATFDEVMEGVGRDGRVSHFFLDIKVPAELAELAGALAAKALTGLERAGIARKAVFMTIHERVFPELARAVAGRAAVALEQAQPPLQGAAASEEYSAVVKAIARGSRYAILGMPPAMDGRQKHFLRWVKREVERRDDYNEGKPPDERMLVIAWVADGDGEIRALLRLDVDGLLTNRSGRAAALATR